MEWIPHSVNKADYISCIQDFDDWSISPQHFFPGLIHCGVLIWWIVLPISKTQNCQNSIADSGALVHPSLMHSLLTGLVM